MRNVLILSFLMFLFTSYSFSKENISSFEDYKIIIERNIFDGNRNAPVKKLPVSKPTPVIPPPPVLEHITLVGAMIQTNNKTSLTQEIAFFSGSKPEYSVALKKGMKIAGFEIINITTSNIILDKKGYQINLPVGKSVTGNKEVEWKPTDSSVSVVGSTKETPKVSEDNSELLKKLIERRRQQLSSQ